MARPSPPPAPPQNYLASGSEMQGQVLHQRRVWVGRQAEAERCKAEGDWGRRCAAIGDSARAGWTGAMPSAPADVEQCCLRKLGSPALRPAQVWSRVRGKIYTCWTCGCPQPGTGACQVKGHPTLRSFCCMQGLRGGPQNACNRCLRSSSLK